MKVTAEFEVNEELRNFFIERLRDTAAGMGREDRIEVEKMIAEAENDFPDDWSEIVKKELVTMLLIDAGFTYAEGYYARAYEAPRN
jgi:hypothetical protein